MRRFGTGRGIGRVSGRVRRSARGRIVRSGGALLLAAILLAGCELEERAPGGPDAWEGVPSAVGDGSEATRDGPSAIFLVRHAERAGEAADDPGLTPVGQERARDLGRLLRDAGITRIHSSDTRRTRETARPLADELGIEVEIYDHRDPTDFLRELEASPGRHLVVGHSNTIPDLAQELGGRGYGEIEEAWEYDRLYVLTPGRDGVETILLRFGAPASP